MPCPRFTPRTNDKGRASPYETRWLRLRRPALRSSAPLPKRGPLSLPFEAGQHKRIAVKIGDDRGIESLKVVEVA